MNSVEKKKIDFLTSKWYEKSFSCCSMSSLTDTVWLQRHVYNQKDVEIIP